MRKASLILIGAATGLVLAIGPARLPFAPGGVAIAASSDYRSLDLLDDAFERVRKQYVEQPTDKELMGAAINGMLAGLEDSYFVDAKALRSMEVCTGPGCDFAGVGIEFTVVDGLAKVIAPIDASPAAKAGIMTGDIIAEIDDQSAQGLTVIQVADRLRGEAGSSVRLSLARPGRDGRIEVTIVRERLGIESVRFRAEEGDVGYIRIARFGDRTGEELKKAIGGIAAQIAPEKLKGYVIDLRNNPGGLLEGAVAVADDFLEAGEIVSIRGRGTNEVQRIRAAAGDLARGKPIVVLINAGSAAAAEIGAGALQDNRRATIVGTRSFGRGTVGKLIPLGPQIGAIHLTTGHYVTPAGRVIEAKGISPDREVRQDEPKDGTEAKSRRDGETALQSYVPPDAKDDKALKLAFEILRRPATATKAN